MTLFGKCNSLGGSVQSYPPGKILFNGNNGATSNINFKRGVYYIRGQGAGGSGGDCGYYGTGGGGGSGAGFEGKIYFNNNIGSKKCYCAPNVPDSRINGEATYITNILTLGGGGCGGTDHPLAGIGGILDIPSTTKIISATIKSNGNNGNFTDGINGTKGGSNSVLTNTGAGTAGGSPLESRHATAPGAGGAGGIQWDGKGGFGKFGELIIKYVKYKP